MKIQTDAEPETPDVAFARAQIYLLAALDLVRDDTDPLVQIDAAAQCCRIAMGEADPDAMDFGEPDDLGEDCCTCPTGLVERGGFTSTCPVHASI